MKRKDWEAFKANHPHVLSDPLWGQTQLAWEGGDEGRLFLVLLPYVGAKAGDRHELIDLIGLHQIANMASARGRFSTQRATILELADALSRLGPSALAGMMLVLLKFPGAVFNVERSRIEYQGIAMAWDHYSARFEICGPVLDATTTAFLVEVRETVFHAPGGHGLQVDGLSALIGDGKVEGFYVQGLELTY